MKTAALPQPAAPSPLEMQASLDHQGPLYPGQPVIYRLTLWLPTSMQNPALSELSSAHFTIRRLGSDEWLAPAQAGLPGRLTRSWLIQAKSPGRWLLDSPRLQGVLPQPGSKPLRLSARAAPLSVRVDQAPAPLVATGLALSQHIEPTTGKVGEPLIRTLTLTLENGDSGQTQLPQLMAQQLPTDLQAQPDGERQQEHYREGKLLFEREWRQTLVASQPGEYLLPRLLLPWFNTASGRIEQASLPAMKLTFEPATGSRPDALLPSQLGNESLRWAVLALLLRGMWRNGPRWRAFYRLQRALACHQPEASRHALHLWATLRWPISDHRPPQSHVQGLNYLSALQADLARACFAPVQPSRPLQWQRHARELCHYETIGVAQLLTLIARNLAAQG
nr:hypothetical protein [Aeromonas finlandensis]